MRGEGERVRERRGEQCFQVSPERCAVSGRKQGYGVHSAGRGFFQLATGELQALKRKGVRLQIADHSERLTRVSESRCCAHGAATRFQERVRLSPAFRLRQIGEGAGKGTVRHDDEDNVPWPFARRLEVPRARVILGNCDACSRGGRDGMRQVLQRGWVCMTHRGGNRIIGALFVAQFARNGRAS